MKPDYEIYAVFKSLIGPGRKYLYLRNFQAILEQNWDIMVPHAKMKLAIARQFPIDTMERVDEMRYTDFLELVKPKKAEFQSFVNRKMRESDLGYPLLPNLGLSEDTGFKFAQLFEDIIRLEYELESQRQF